MSRKIYEEHGGRLTTIIDLPGVIVDHIVPLLSMRDLACMRASFKAWRYLWYATPYVRLDITHPLDTLEGLVRFGIEDKIPSLRCVLRLSDKLHDYMSTMSLLNVDFLKLCINFSDFEMQFIASFLGMFLNLKYLSILQSAWNDCIHFPQSNVFDIYWASQNLAFLQQLKLAEINLYPGENALALVKYLIKNGKELEIIVIRYSSRFWNLRKLERMMDDVKKEKASPKLVLYYIFEEVNEHHRKYARLLTEKEKKGFISRRYYIVFQSSRKEVGFLLNSWMRMNQ
ncbi:hypothetical protein AQUCO_02000075v1 [Aquilegia coerulea]|uniref:F-box domain-containing protein n=2 Tax=Aquilegia coerulea TaxID=218851 RepID=A0A2G5DFV6_AQUCA|nr:hypothetical protein AQUCO_02000075v1 [Aquilegia coerulea]